ncbi:unnamed protein product [Mytilus edulis]|uniref:Uncharacterized protein n=1 Tax=Mytilus edulis TaxID=6550 RepID=A0A8S3QUM7_MYTED|nr:unnamed protein product [Mytilus edulis]
MLKTLSVIIFSDATCSLPQDLINTAWEYNYTNVKDNTEQSTTLNFATTTLQSSAINLDAKGTTIDDWTCINSLSISDTEAVVVFKSDNSFSDGPFAGSQWLYLCMKLTKVTTDLYYFYLLSDTFTGVTPEERVFASEEGNPPNNNDPVCNTFCQYTESPNIRTLQKPGTHDALPNGASLCEPCGSSCKVATTEMTSTESTQKTTIPPTSTEIDTAIELTSKETTPITSQPTTSTEIDIITTIQSTDITQITSQPTTSTEVNTIITIQSTETTYIPTMHSTSTETVTTADMTSTNANKETTIPNTSTELGTTTEVESPSTSLEINPLPTSTEMDSLTETTTKETTQTTAVHSTVVDSETTQITTTQFTTKDTETTTELKILTTDLKVETTLETLVTGTLLNIQLSDLDDSGNRNLKYAKCSLPDELQSSTWEYNYTHVIDNSEQSATISTGTNTMQTSVIYDVQGTKLSRWTCINSLNISNTQDVVVFK